MVVIGVRMVVARMPRIVVIEHRIVGVTMVVRMVVVIGVHVVVPAMAMDIVVVAANKVVVVVRTAVVMIGRDMPIEVGSYSMAAEAQVVGCAIEVAGALIVEPYTLEVERHIDLFAGIGVVSIEPDLVVLGVDLLGPDLVDESVGLDFVFVATVDHNLTLSVEIFDSSQSLPMGEIADR